MKINIWALPPELHLELLSWLDLESCIHFLNSLNLNVDLAYRNCQFIRSREYIKLICIKLHRLLNNKPKNFRLLLSNKNFTSSFTCAEAFIIAAYCGFNEEAHNVLSNRTSLNWNQTEQDYELDLQRNLEISNAQAIHGIRMAFSIGESSDDSINS